MADPNTAEPPSIDFPRKLETTLNLFRTRVDCARAVMYRLVKINRVMHVWSKSPGRRSFSICPRHNLISKLYARPYKAKLSLNLITLCALSLDAYVPLQRTTFQFCQASSQLSFAAKERQSPWLIAVLWTLTTFCMAS